MENHTNSEMRYIHEFLFIMTLCIYFLYCYRSVPFIIIIIINTMRNSGYSIKIGITWCISKYEKVWIFFWILSSTYRRYRRNALRWDTLYTRIKINASVRLSTALLNATLSTLKNALQASLASRVVSDAVCERVPRRLLRGARSGNSWLALQRLT